MTPVLKHDGAVMHLAFNRDGDKIATASDDDKARIWNLGFREVAAMSIEELLLYLKVLSGQELDETRSGLRPVDSTSLRNACDKLRNVLSTIQVEGN